MSLPWILGSAGESVGETNPTNRRNSSRDTSGELPDLKHFRATPKRNERHGQAYDANQETTSSSCTDPPHESFMKYSLHFAGEDLLDMDVFSFVSPLVTPPPSFPISFGATESGSDFHCVLIFGVVVYRTASAERATHSFVCTGTYCHDTLSWLPFHSSRSARACC
jgi:hypothetical protein